MLMQSLEKLPAGRTSFVIAHRPPTDPQREPDRRAARRRHRGDRNVLLSWSRAAATARLHGTQFGLASERRETGLLTRSAS
ncbi:MAG: hypothetical protein U1E86_28770 [Burkholderiaceae bacterium]